MKYVETNTIHLVWQDNHFKTWTTNFPSQLIWGRSCENVWFSFSAWALGCFSMISILSSATDGTKWKLFHHGKLGPTAVFKLSLCESTVPLPQAVEWVSITKASCWACHPAVWASAQTFLFFFCTPCHKHRCPSFCFSSKLQYSLDCLQLYFVEFDRLIITVEHKFLFLINIMQSLMIVKTDGREVGHELMSWMVFILLNWKKLNKQYPSIYLYC